MTRRLFSKILFVVVAIFGLLVFSRVLLAQGRSQDAFERVKEVQERHTDRLMAIDGVEGTAVGLDDSDRPAVKVFLENQGVRGIPRELDGVPVHPVVTGKFYALPKPEKPPGKPGGGQKIDPKKRCDRPVPIGVSTGNEGECSSGTIGCRVTDGTNVYALSNNHVYALENAAPIGSRVLQPGTYDAKPPCSVRSADVIGTLAAFEPISFGGLNIIDAAIALSSTANLGNATPANGYGIPKSIPATAYLGQAVQKYGRTTSLTKGTVTAINATVDVGYSSGTARFVDQIIVQSSTAFIGAGDSGSLLVTDSGRNPVGLLFAGDQTGTYAVANRIDLVLGAFDVTVDGDSNP